MDVLMTLLATAGVNFLIAVPGADDVMLNYQSLSYHDVLGLRHLLGKPPAPEFEAWLENAGWLDDQKRLPPWQADSRIVRNLLEQAV
jgi:ethanolamine ammonia-lyase large subunit